MDKNRHINIPVFIPHMGCPHTCVFCDQRRISGSMSQSPERVQKLLAESMATTDPQDSVEIAFFGGSFTGIPIPEMIAYLEAAKPYIKDQRVKGIRLSTRPDYITPDIMKILVQYGVTVIELGVQSLDEEVLRLSRRGHTPDDVTKACKTIRDFGIKLGIQTMIGLPGDSLDKTLETARRVVELRPDMVRVYPALVLKGTELEQLYMSGRYKPLTLEEAVQWCSSIIPFYRDAGITILRIGLHSSETLEDSIVSGPYHPAFGELVESRILLAKLTDEMDKHEPWPDHITVLTRPELISKLIGHKRSNIEYIKKWYDIREVRVEPGLTHGEFEILTDERGKT